MTDINFRYARRSRTRWLYCFLMAGALTVSSASAAPQACPREPEFLEHPLHLPHVHAVRAAGQRLEIVVLRSSDKHSKGGLKGWESTDRLVHWLRQSWGNKSVQATLLQQPNLGATGWVATMPAILDRYDPALLIWDVSNIDARRGTDLYEFAEAIENVIVMLSESRADLLLLDLEYHPEFGMWVDSEPYLELLQQVVRGYPAVLFPRNRITREWLQELEPLVQFERDHTKLTKYVNDCLGQVLATAIARAVTQSEAIEAEEDM